LPKVAKSCLFAIKKIAHPFALGSLVQFEKRVNVRQFHYQRQCYQKVAGGAKSGLSFRDSNAELE
jgi:hypothetical protein